MIAVRIPSLLACLIVAACQTPQPLLDSAELSRAHLATLRAESSRYLDDANQSAVLRMRLLNEAYARDLDDDQTVIESRRISLGGIKALIALDDELTKLAGEYAARGANKNAQVKANAAELAAIKAVKAPSKSLKDAEDAIGKLAEEQSDAEMIASMLAYARAVKAAYKAKRPAPPKGSPEEP